MVRPSWRIFSRYGGRGRDGQGVAGLLARRGPSGYEFPASLPDCEKEKIKLRATFINGLAIGVVLVWVFTPITRAAYDPAVTGDAFFFMAASALICFALGFLLHYYAMRHLDGLNP